VALPPLRIATPLQLAACLLLLPFTWPTTSKTTKISISTASLSQGSATSIVSLAGFRDIGFGCPRQVLSINDTISRGLFRLAPTPPVLSSPTPPVLCGDYVSGVLFECGWVDALQRSDPRRYSPSQPREDVELRRLRLRRRRPGL